MSILVLLSCQADLAYIFDIIQGKLRPAAMMQTITLLVCWELVGNRRAALWNSAAREVQDFVLLLSTLIIDSITFHAHPRVSASDWNKVGLSIHTFSSAISWALFSDRSSASFFFSAVNISCRLMSSRTSSCNGCKQQQHQSVALPLICCLHPMHLMIISWPLQNYIKVAEGGAVQSFSTHLKCAGTVGTLVLTGFLL